MKGRLLVRLVSIWMLLIPTMIYSQTFYGDTIWTRDYSSTAANSCAFSPDAGTVAVAYDCMGPMVRVLSVADGHVIWESATPNLCLYNIQFSSNGQYIAIAEEQGHLMVIDITIPDTIYNIATTTGGLNAVDFSSDGNYIYAGGNDGSIRVFETTTGAMLQNIPAHSDAVLTLDVSSSGHFLSSGSKDNSTKVFDLLNNYAEVHSFNDNLDDIKTVKFTPFEDRLLSGGVDNKIHVYNLADATIDTVLSFHSADVNSIDISSDGYFAVSGSDDQSVRMFNLNNYDSVSIFTNSLQTRVNGVALTPSMDKMAAGNHIGGVILYDIHTLISTENYTQNSILVYPNPATDYIMLTGLKESSLFEIINLNGQVIRTGMTSNYIDISALSKGVYILHLSDRFSRFIKN